MKSGLASVRLGLILFAVFGIFFELFIVNSSMNTVLDQTVFPLLLIGGGAFLLARPELFRSKKLS